jgi:hypothetical protein
MRAVLQAAIGKAEEESIVELSATTTTPPVVVWVPIRAARDLRDTPSSVSRRSWWMGAVLQAAIGKALLVLEESIVELPATTSVSTSPVARWGRGRHLRATKDLRYALAWSP